MKIGGRIPLETTLRQQRGVRSNVKVVLVVVGRGIDGIDGKSWVRVDASSVLQSDTNGRDLGVGF